MNAADRMAQNDKNKNKRSRKPDWEEEEETLTYRVRQKETSLNEESGVFRSQLKEGINVQQSVFDRTAVFHIKERE